MKNKNVLMKNKNAVKTHSINRPESVSEKQRQNLSVANKGITHVLATENKQEEMRLTVLKSGAGGMEYITDTFWRAKKNDVAGHFPRGDFVLLKDYIMIQDIKGQQWISFMSLTAEGFL
ncbi:uncharacterized protein PAE49_006480 [Odontesthes bonariensis]